MTPEMLSAAMRLLLVAGVAIGSGWQALVAYVNIGSYYLVGVPIGIILGWPLGFGVRVRIIKRRRVTNGSLG
jgi:Na+-driven multidrug efflux pump